MSGHQVINFETILTEMENMNELTGVDRIIISCVPNLSKQILALTGHIIKYS